LESVTHIIVVEVGLPAPYAAVAHTSFGDKAMNMGVPFKVSAKGMKYADKARSELFGFTIFMKHT